MKTLFSIALLAVVILFGAFFLDRNSSYAIGPVLRSGANVASMNSNNLINPSGTTTASLLRNGSGTTTLTFASDNFDALAINMRAFSSTTNVLGYINLQVQVSDDGIDYFDFDPTVLNPAQIYVASTTIQLASTTVPWQWRPATRGATTTKAFVLPIPPSRFTKLIFSEGTTTAVTTGLGGGDETFIYVNAIGKLSSTIR